MAQEFINTNQANVNDKEVPTADEFKRENQFYDANTNANNELPADYWKYMGMAALGGKPMSSFTKTRPETWQEESLRKLSKAFSRQEQAQTYSQMRQGAHQYLMTSGKRFRDFLNTPTVTEDGTVEHRNIWEHPEFGTAYRASHVLNDPGFEQPANDLHPRFVQNEMMKLNVGKNSPFEAGKPIAPGEKMALIHQLMSGDNDEHTEALRKAYASNPTLTKFINTFGYNKNKNSYFLRNTGKDFFTIDRSQFARNRMPYKTAGKFMNALASVSNDEIPIPQYKEVSSFDNERTRNEKNTYNQHLRTASAFARPAIATGRTLGWLAQHSLKGIAPLAAPIIGALTSVAAPTIAGTIMHHYAAKRTENELRHKRFGANPYDIIRRGY